MTDQNSERRTQARRIVSWRGQAGDETGKEMDARIVDVSRDGLGLLAEAPLPFGAMVTVTAFIPPHDPAGTVTAVQLQGKLVFCVMARGRFRIGIHIPQMDTVARQALAPFL